MKTAVLFCLIMVLIQTGCREPEEIILTENSIPGLSILLPPQPTIVQEFAAGEMVKYLHRISGADFEINQGERDLTGRYIELCLDKAEPGDGYTIIADSRKIRLTGNSDRAILYSVYDFLERLGCKFLAPEFS